MKQKTTNWLSIVTLVVLALGLMAFAPPPPHALPPLQTPSGDKLVMGTNYTLESGDTIHGSLYVFGSNAELQEDTTVTGDVMVFGGNLQANGTIKGSINLFGGLVTLGKSAVVNGDVNALSSTVSQDPGAQVKGQVNTTMHLPPFTPAPAAIPNLPVNPPAVSQTRSIVDAGIGLIGKLLWWVARSFFWAFLALLVVMFWPRHTQRIADTVIADPVPSGGLGLLTVIVIPLVLVLLALTICGIPISLIGALALVVAWAFGIIGLGLETGGRIEKMIHIDWAPPVQAAIGTFALTLVTNGFGLIPCIGWLVPFAVGCIGLGAALLTRFGSQPYPPASAAVLSLPPSAPATPGVPATQFINPPEEGGAQVYGPESDGLPPAS